MAETNPRGTGSARTPAVIKTLVITLFVSAALLSSWNLLKYLHYTSLEGSRATGWAKGYLQVTSHGLRPETPTRRDHYYLLAYVGRKQISRSTLSYIS